jgi:hypothetical protein
MDVRQTESNAFGQRIIDLFGTTRCRVSDHICTSPAQKLHYKIEQTRFLKVFAVAAAQQLRLCSPDLASAEDYVGSTYDFKNGLTWR